MSGKRGGRVMSAFRHPVGGWSWPDSSGGIGILLGGVYGAVGVFWGAIDGVEDEWIDAGVAEVVSSAGGDGHQIALIHPAGLAGDVGPLRCR